MGMMMGANGVDRAGKQQLAWQRSRGNKATITNGTLHPLLCVIPQLIRIAYFGDMTLIVDIYSKKGTGIIDLQPRWPVDFKFLHPELVSGSLDVFDGVEDPA